MRIEPEHTHLARVARTDVAHRHDLGAAIATEREDSLGHFPFEQCAEGAQIAHERGEILDPALVWRGVQGELLDLMEADVAKVVAYPRSAYRDRATGPSALPLREEDVHAPLLS
jgi:hypothetical protein